MTIEVLDVTEELLNVVELTCVTSELVDDPTKLEGVTTIALLSGVTKLIL